MGFCVDAIFFTKLQASPLPESSVKNGEFKYSVAKAYFTTRPHFPSIPQPQQYNQYNIEIGRNPPKRHTAYLGAGGIGKTFPLITNPCYNQAILAHTIKSRESIKLLAKHPNNVVCLQKYAMPSVVDDKAWQGLRYKKQIPQRHCHVLIDEVFCHSKKTMKLVFRRLQELDNTIIELTGDPEQICNEIEGAPVTVEWLREMGFDIKYINRAPETPARHQYDYGLTLDSLRNHTPAEQQQQVLGNPMFKQVAEIDFTAINPTIDHVLSGNHVRIAQINQLAKNSQHPQIKVKDRKGNTHVIDKNDANIWWDRKNMAQKNPKKYEPAFAITVDCYQGTTADCNIVVDVLSLTRHGALYTAMTRTRTSDNIAILIQ